jgi:phytanoyl-CoA hydroxylase
MTILNSSEKNFYAENGYLILNNFIAKNVCDNLMTRANFLVENFEPSSFKTVFNTKDQRHAKHAYFLESGSKIHFFFEDGALDSAGNLKYEKRFCINKIGHALHELDSIFQSFSYSEKIHQLTEDLEIANPLMIQSMYIYKQPRIGGEVTCHQDSTYLYAKNHPVVGFWFALEDATLENGCLWAIPGGHTSPLKSRLVKSSSQKTSVEIYDSTPWNIDKMIPLEVPRGSLIILHGLLPHMSKENTSDKSRHAFSLHVISGNDEYPVDNWLQRPAHMPFKNFKIV